MSLAFIKLGGSALTDKRAPESLNLPVLRALAAGLAELRRELPELRLLLGHGGGSFGHFWAHRYGTAGGIAGPDGWEGFARVVDAMARLNRAVVAELLEAGVPAVGLAPSASGRSSDGALVELALGPVAALLEAGVVPVLFGDVVVDERRGCAIISTEALFSYLAPRLQPERIVLVGEAAVYSADPHRDLSAAPIPEITRANYQAIQERLGGSHGVDVTGGMASKVRAMWSLVEQQPGLVVQIIGPEPALLREALSGRRLPLGTTIHD